MASLIMACSPSAILDPPLSNSPKIAEGSPLGASGSGSRATSQRRMYFHGQAVESDTELLAKAASVVADTVAGEVVTIALRDRQVAIMAAVTSSRLEELVSSGRARPPHGNITDLPAPEAGPRLSEELKAMRSGELGGG